MEIINTPGRKQSGQEPISMAKFFNYSNAHNRLGALLFQQPLALHRLRLLFAYSLRCWQKIENKFALPLVVVGECDKN